MKNILVTGSNGQLGKTIEELYSKTNIEYNFTFVTKSQLDITDEKIVKSFFSKNKFDYCINCAAYTNVEQAEKTPDIAYKINAEAVKYLAEACLETKTILIHISTDYVFDGEKKEPYMVEDLPNPINEYGKSKLLGEKNIQNILKRYFIIRTSWLYSKKYGKNFYKTILTKAQTEKELFVTTEQLGCPTDTVNLTDYILDLIKLKKANYGIHHFCDEEVMSWYSFAEQILIEKSIKHQVRLHKTEEPSSFVNRPKYSVMISSK
jgi:dTDP-4-dehydrorhamnose reductase